jgi:fatty-acid peroxygenase
MPTSGEDDAMPAIPGNTGLDHSLALLREGYQFMPRRRQRYGSDIFQTRLLLQKTICMSGEEAARLFYDKTYFTREGAAPLMLQKTLFGQGGVQTLDGEAHQRRKQMFMSLMSKQAIDELADMVAQEWRRALDDWAARDSVVLFDALHDIITRAVCAWAGVPLAESEVQQRAQDLTNMFEHAGGAGPRLLKARRARKRGNAWIGRLIEQVRGGELSAEEGRVLHTMAWHRDLNGELLDVHTAAVEVLNVLRPTVAVERFITCAALELLRHPEYRERLQTDDELLEPFVQEVRRLYSFLPFVSAKVRKSFEWKGYHFPEGTRVMLDLYGTNRDPRIWEDPEAFRPERFRRWNGSAFNFIPQGGGNRQLNHRCPGEWIAIELIKVGLHMLTREMDYDVPAQDLTVDLSRIPMLPKSRFVIHKVRPAAQRESTLRAL